MPGIGKDQSADGGQASEARTRAEVPLGMGMEEAHLSNQVAMKARLREDPGCQGLQGTKIGFLGTNREQKGINRASRKLRKLLCLILALAFPSQETFGINTWIHSFTETPSYQWRSRERQLGLFSAQAVKVSTNHPLPNPILT